MKTMISLKHRKNILFCAGAVTVSVLLLACTEDGSDLDAEIPTGNITTIAGTAGDFNNTGDGGAALNAKLGYINGVTVDADGNIFFSDAAANVIRKIDRVSGNISTLAGTFLGGFNVIDPTPYAGDGGPARAAHLNIPLGVAVDSNGNIYIADSGNNAVRKINASTGMIATIAGNPGEFANNGDGGPATEAGLYTPYDVAVDQSSNVYIVDSQNHVIRKITASTGIITTVVGTLPGTAGYAGDGFSALSAKLNTPQGVTVDASGNLYIVDSGNHAVRMVNASTGIITTIAGTGTYGYSGDGGPGTAAKLYAPSRAAVDASGDVYIADQGNNVIRKIKKSTGIISTLAGTGVAGYSGDGGPANAAELFSPQGVAVDAENNVFITDKGNSVIRAVKQE